MTTISSENRITIASKILMETMEGITTPQDKDSLTTEIDRTKTAILRTKIAMVAISRADTTISFQTTEVVDTTTRAMITEAISSSHRSTTERVVKVVLASAAAAETATSTITLGRGIKPWAKGQDSNTPGVEADHLYEAPLAIKTTRTERSKGLKNYD